MVSLLVLQWDDAWESANRQVDKNNISGRDEAGSIYRTLGVPHLSAPSSAKDLRRDHFRFARHSGRNETATPVVSVIACLEHLPISSTETATLSQ